MGGNLRPSASQADQFLLRKKTRSKLDDLVKNLLDRHPGESRGPEHLEITGFRLSPE
jgi:hypothetical protein